MDFTTSEQEPMTGTTDNLDDLLQTGDATAKPYPFIPGHNFGHFTLQMTLSMFRFYEMSEVANREALEQRPEFADMQIAQRPLDEKHASKLAVYLLKGLLDQYLRKLVKDNRPVPNSAQEIVRQLGSQPYFGLQPIVANIRSCGPAGKGLKFRKLSDNLFEVFLSDRDVLWIIDGQHRRYAMELVFEFLKHVLNRHQYPAKSKIYAAPEKDYKLTIEEVQMWSDVFGLARTQCTISVEVHLGLQPDQERQLFHDLNNLGKKVESSLAFEYDNSNPVNLFIRNELIIADFWKAEVFDRDIVDWHKDPGAISRKDLIAVNAVLLLNKTNINGANPGDIESKREFALRFWEEVSGIRHFGSEGARSKTVAAQPVVLKALAKLAYDHKFGKFAHEGDFEKLMTGIRTIDFSHRNPMWRYYDLTPEQRTEARLHDLQEYLPEQGGGNRDIGKFDEVNGWMRFGAKHNDIHPIIGDMIRWNLGLKSRHADAVVAASLNLPPGDYEKVLAATMKIGLSREDAEKAVQAMAGKDVGA